MTKTSFAPSDIRGIIPPLVTPFDADEEVDEAALRRELGDLAPGRLGKIVGPAPIAYGGAELNLSDAALHGGRRVACVSHATHRQQ